MTPPGPDAPGSPDRPVEIRVLGAVTVQLAGRLVPIGDAKHRLMLAMLVAAEGRRISTAQLISQIWGDDPPRTAPDLIYSYASDLRRNLARGLEGAAPVLPRHNGGGYRLVVGRSQVDLYVFRDLASRARSLAGTDPGQAVALWRQGLALWGTGTRGNPGDGPFTDLTVSAVADCQWLKDYRPALREEYRAALIACFETELRLGEDERLIPELADLAAADPLDERIAGLLMVAYYRGGRQAQATRLYRDTRQRLSTDLGVEPSQQLKGLYRKFLNQDPSLSLVDPPGPEPGEEPESAHLRSRRGHQAAGPAGIPAAGPAGIPAAVSRPDASLSRPISGLPGADRHFTGRDRELDVLVRSVTDQDGPPVCVVSGMAGVGKTAFVVHAARQVAGQFPDGTLFIDLHGNTAGHEPLTPADALDRLLRRIGIDGERIPPSVDERAALYRRLLAGRQMLILLDDARDAAQVRPLLPGEPGCAVVITSRLRLTALDEGREVPLDVLGQADAEALFRSIVGTERLLAEPDADATLARIVRRCWRLPLAIRIAAARHRARPLHALADLEARMSDAHAALTELEDDDRSVAASFNMSLTDLPAELRRSFALLAVHPGPDLDASAAAALMGLPRTEAVRHLDGLVARHLLTEHARGRYRFHDLIAVFARDYALAPMPAAERTAALRRIIDYSLRAAEVADSLITPHRFRVPLDVADRTAALPPLPDYDTALTWLTAEQANLADACVAAGESGLDKSCWQLAYTLRGYYFLTKHWQSWLRTHQAALAAARRCGDVRAEAMTVNNLGLAHLELGHHAAATACYEDARRLFAAVGDLHGEQTARANLAWIRFAEHEYTDFLREIRPVLDFYRQAGAERNAAITQRGIGLAEAELGQTEAAVADLRQALDDFTRLGLHLDAIMTVNGLGETYQRAGDHANAADAFESSLIASQRYGSEFEYARARHRLGQLAADAGNPEQARQHWHRALDDYRRLGAPQAVDLHARLTELDA
jgi:DNA-binding SARP family transcriptional activator/tetratricopeptide (TPR) repeat protein